MNGLFFLVQSLRVILLCNVVNVILLEQLKIQQKKNGQMLVMKLKSLIIGLIMTEFLNKNPAHIGMWKR